MSNTQHMFDPDPLKDGEVLVSSRLRLFWLTRLRGYSVKNVHRTPKESTFGQFYYVNQWILAKKDENGSDN